MFKGLTTLLFNIPDQWKSEADGERWLRFWTENLPSFLPEKVNNFEPISVPYHSIGDALRYWKCPFLWKRRKAVRSEGSIFMDMPGLHRGVSIDTKAPKLPIGSMLEFLRKASVVFSSDISYMHRTDLREPEVFAYDRWHPLQLGLSTHDLRKGIPLLPWATVFGSPYVRLLGIENFLSAPAHQVLRLNDDQVYIQVTESLDDLRTDFEAFAHRRAAVMDHLSPLFQGSEFGVQVPPEILAPIGARSSGD